MQEQQQTIGFYKFYHLSKKSSISGCRTLCNAMTMNMLHPNRHQMKMLKTLHQDKQERLEKEQAKRVDTLIKKKTQEEERKFRKQKEARKQVARAISKAEAREHKSMSKGKK